MGNVRLFVSYVVLQLAFHGTETSYHRSCAKFEGVKRRLSPRSVDSQLSSEWDGCSSNRTATGWRQ